MLCGMTDDASDYYIATCRNRLQANYYIYNVSKSFLFIFKKIFCPIQKKVHADYVVSFSNLSLRKIYDAFFKSFNMVLYVAVGQCTNDAVSSLKEDQTLLWESALLLFILQD